MSKKITTNINCCMPILTEQCSAQSSTLLSLHLFLSFFLSAKFLFYPIRFLFLSIPSTVLKNSKSTVQHYIPPFFILLTSTPSASSVLFCIHMKIITHKNYKLPNTYHIRFTQLRAVEKEVVAEVVREEAVLSS